jgi:hypothetical protein
MKRLLVVSFIIGLLSASIHALSTEPEGNAALPEQYYAASPAQYYAAPPTQYYAAPPAQYYAAPPAQSSDPLVELRRQGAIRDSFSSHNSAMTQNTIDLMRAYSPRPR